MGSCDSSFYNYRSYDFGCLFASLQFDFSAPKFPYFTRDRGNIPSEELRKDMISRYVRRLDMPGKRHNYTSTSVF